MTADLSVDDLTASQVSQEQSSGSERVIKRRISRDARRERFLDAAAEIAVESGVASVTMDGVALRTDVDKRLAYRHFINRDDLLSALVDRELAKMRQRTDAILAPDAPWETRVRVNARSWLDSVVERGPLMRKLLYDQGLLERYALEVRGAAVSDWSRHLAAATGLKAPKAGALTRMLLSALVGAVEAVEQGDLTAHEAADLYADMVLATVGRHLSGPAQDDGAR